MRATAKATLGRSEGHRCLALIAAEREAAEIEWVPRSEAAQQAFDAGRYVDAVRIEEVLAVEVEQFERAKQGKPGAGTAAKLGGLAWYELFAGYKTKALAVAERAPIVDQSWPPEPHSSCARRRDAIATLLVHDGSRNRTATPFFLSACTVTRR